MAAYFSLDLARCNSVLIASCFEQFQLKMSGHIVIFTRYADMKTFHILQLNMN